VRSRGGHIRSFWQTPPCWLGRQLLVRGRCGALFLNGAKLPTASVPIGAEPCSTSPATGVDRRSRRPEKTPPQCWTSRGAPNKLSTSTSVVRNHGSAGAASNGAQVVRRGLARPAIGNDIERDLLSLVEAAHSRTLDGADMHEHILAAVIGLNEAIAPLGVEELYGALCRIIPRSDCVHA
jgi:hypothetical protein